MQIKSFSAQLTKNLASISRPLLYKLLEIQKVANNIDTTKADKVDNPTVDNIATLDAYGNVKDSGKDIPDGEVLGTSDIGSDNSILVTDNGNGTLTLSVKIRTGYGIDVDTNGLKLKQQSHLADAAAVSSITLGTGTDHVDRDVFNTALAGLVAEVNNINNVLNNLIARLEAAEILASS